MVGVTSITVSSSPLPVVVQQEQSNTEDDDSQEEEKVSLKSFDAITSSAQVNLEQSVVLIDILPDFEEVKEDFSEVSELFPAPDKVFKILFRRIISPNAP